MVTNLSESGLFLNRLLVPMDRRQSSVQLELILPGTSDTVWASGQVCYDTLDSYFHGTGVRFTAIADAHARMIRNFVMDTRVMRLKRFLDRLRHGNAPGAIASLAPTACS